MNRQNPDNSERERKARELRNADDYDDWAYGTEPIPGEPWPAERNPAGPAAP